MLRGKVENGTVLKESDQKRYAKFSEESSVATARKDTRRRCHSCGATTHLAADCPTKDKGVKCFGCHDYGHVAAQCPKKQIPSKSTCSVAKLQRSEIHFRGMESVDNVTLGKFHTTINIDNNNFPIDINVISDDLMQHELLIGTDF